MSSSDPLINAFPKVTTSRFKSIDWPDWPENVHNPKFAGQLRRIFYGGVYYVTQVFQLERSPYLTIRLGPHSIRFLHLWNPQFYDKEWQPIVKGDRSILATFHSGALHAIKKLNEDIETATNKEELLKEGLDECVNSLEEDVHRQFAMRVEAEILYAEKVEDEKIMDALEEMAEKLAESKVEDENDQEEQANDDCKQSEDKDQGDVEGEEPVKRRNQAKSKKAKKMKKKMKQGKGKGAKDEAAT